MASRCAPASLPVRAAAGKQITTIEGIHHPLQDAFVEEGAMQCGYCTSGMIVSGVALLKQNSAPQPRRNRASHERQYLPLRHLPAHRRGHPKGGPSPCLTHPLRIEPRTLRTGRPARLSLRRRPPRLPGPARRRPAGGLFRRARRSPAAARRGEAVRRKIWTPGCTSAKMAR